MVDTSDLEFWGWETLAQNDLFSINMDGDNARLTIYFHKVTSEEHLLWIELQYQDWQSLLELIHSLDRLNEGNPLRSHFASIERLASDAVMLRIGAVSLTFPFTHFVALCDTIREADKRILKLGREE
jgi:hypothetical protein